MTPTPTFYRVKNLRPDLDGRIIRVVVPNDIGSDHPNLEPVSAERAEIKAALRAGDMDMAWTWVSRLVGNRIAAGDITVKLKRHRL